MRCHYCKNESSDLKSFVLSGMWPVLTLDQREELFFEASFVVFHHDFIAYYISFRK